MRGKISGKPQGKPLGTRMKKALLDRVDAYNEQHKQPGEHVGPITRTHKLVLETLLFTFHNSQTGFCFPSHERLAQAAKCCRDTVITALKTLEEAGFLSWVHRLYRRAAVVRRSSNSYWFIVPAAVSENQTETLNQRATDSNKEPCGGSAAVEYVILDRRNPVEDALARFGAAIGRFTIPPSG